MKDFWQKLKIYGPGKFFRFAVLEVWHKLYLQTIKGSYSQKGEDLVIDRLLSYKKAGFYVDVGAGDPDRFSNTKRFYLRGWQGINSEPNFSNYQKLVAARPKDINLNLGVAKEKGELTFYEIFPDTLSTFSKEEAAKRQAEGYYIVRETKVPVETLANILAEHLGDNVIDFLSVDTEGFDLIVLQSNDWTKYRPQVICLESAVGKATNINRQPGEYLESLGYQKAYDNGLNCLYLAC
ncbi:MAG: FkbM family methyltransferase [bacterium]|nr:FkbM family methyltransferase [bacterium]